MKAIDIVDILIWKYSQIFCFQTILSRIFFHVMLLNGYSSSVIDSIIRIFMPSESTWRSLQEKEVVL